MIEVTFDLLEPPAPLTSEYLRQVEERCAAATGGEWQPYYGWYFSDGEVYAGDTPIAVASLIETRWSELEELKSLTTADATFIAAAHQDIPLLLQEIRRLRVIEDEFQFRRYFAHRERA